MVNFQAEKWSIFRRKKHLLSQTNYNPINTDNNFINFTHPNSSRNESNFSLDIEHHCITNFSSNNNDFEVNEAIGTLRASFILWKKLDSNNKKQEQFFEYLRGKYNIVLVRTVAEIYQEAQKSVNVNVDVDETIYTNVFVCEKTGYYQLCICDREISWEQKNLQQIYNMLNVFDAKEQQNIKLDLDQNRKMILNKVKVNYVFCVDKPEQNFKLNHKKNSVDLFVPTTLQEKSQDNELWEWYLSDRFGSYKPFIKQWISAYCYYSEYEALHDIPSMRLSNLILTGERGVGKGSFVNLIRDIFGMGFYFGLDVNKFLGKFDTWKKCRLLFLDELQDEEDYNTQKKVYVKLKTETGTDYISMEAKNENSIMIKNQVVFVVASNGESPIFTTYKEKPNNPDANQFFCIDFELSNEYNNGVFSRLQKSFLHYIRTELKDVFMNEVVPNFADNQNIRYIVSTPITERQILLFNSNKSKNDFVIETIVKDIFDNNHKWITQDMFKIYKLDTGKDIDQIRNLIISKKLVQDKSKSTKIKNELGVLKSYQAYHIIPETVNKLIKLYGIE